MTSPRIAFLLVSPLVLTLLFTALVMRDATALDDGEAITVETLYDHERFWPYRIQLVEPWKPVGFEGRFGFGVGVLVRVEPSGLLRIDFAENGVHRVPAGATDAVARANRIRRGEADKTMPNLALWLSGRLLDPTKTPIRPLEKLTIDGARAFLAVVADPAGPEFAGIARDLGGLEKRPGLVPFLMPQGPHRDGGVVNLSRAAGWEHAFLLDRLSPAYTRSLLDAEELAPPATLLLSAEGRLIHGARWAEGAGEVLESIVESAWADVEPSPDGGQEAP